MEELSGFRSSVLRRAKREQRNQSFWNDWICEDRLAERGVWHPTQYRDLNAPPTYTMSSDSRNPDVVAIRSGESRVLLLVGPTVDRQPGTGKLVFQKIGDRYFLHEIRCSACRMNVGFSPSKREKEELTREASNPHAHDFRRFETLRIWLNSMLFP